MKFEQWLGGLLHQKESEVRRLLEHPSALHFLIAWSLFESKCFQGFMKVSKLDAFAERLVSESYSPDKIATLSKYFHERYQDRTRYRNLMHGKECDRLDRALRLPLRDLQLKDRIFLVGFVVYRYRNNMFHGNKGVDSWLKYAEQIDLCTKAMQDFVSHAESLEPTLPHVEVA